MNYRRFGIYMVNFNNASEFNCVQRGFRPAILVSNEQNNTHSPTVQVIPLTGAKKKYLPVHVKLYGFGLNKTSIALCEQIQTIPKCWIETHIGNIDDCFTQRKIINGIKTQLHLDEAV